MKKKVIIIVALVVVLALGGTLAFAAVDEDGQFVNPFNKILSGKVEDGSITQEEANVFTKVWNVIKGDGEEGSFKIFGGRDDFKNGKMPAERPEINKDLMEEIGEAVHVKATEVLGKLVADGVLDAEAVEEAGDRGMDIMIFARGADEETVSALREAAEEIRDYIKTLIDGKIADGTMTQEEAAMFLARGAGGKMPLRQPAGDEDFKRMPGMRGRMGEFAKPEATEEDPNT